ncbi:hypothetical protein Pelo_3162 [Pelomyxa schiedti]|nr:hypothetical protein Pelo_3162 [Pelomyxa schiedti]
MALWLSQWFIKQLEKLLAAMSGETDWHNARTAIFLPPARPPCCLRAVRCSRDGKVCSSEQGAYHDIEEKRRGDILAGPLLSGDDRYASIMSYCFLIKVIVGLGEIGEKELHWDFVVLEGVVLDTAIMLLVMSGPLKAPYGYPTMTTVELLGVKLSLKTASAESVVGRGEHMTVPATTEQECHFPRKDPRSRAPSPMGIEPEQDSDEDYGEVEVYPDESIFPVVESMPTVHRNALNGAAHHSICQLQLLRDSVGSIVFFLFKQNQH